MKVKYQVSMGDLIHNYYELNPNGHYFDPETMKFWNSAIHKCFYIGHGYLFLSSEDNFNRTKIGYTIKLMHDDGRIEKVSEFQEYDNYEDAIERYQEILDGLNE